MEMPFEEVVIGQPALAGVGSDVTEMSESAIIEIMTDEVAVRRRSIVDVVMGMLEAWPLTNGPFFTADGQSATCQAQESHEA
jgi:hypothetical protein